MNINKVDWSKSADEITDQLLILGLMPKEPGFFFTNEGDPRKGEHAPHGDGWANIHTWFDEKKYWWTSRISCELPGNRLGVLEVDGLDEKSSINGAIYCLRNLE